MRVLALDTAQAQAVVALWDGAPGEAGRVLADARAEMERGQAEALLPMVADVMNRAGLGFDAVDRIAATRGPGAFTGIRIGLSAARGLALAAGVPVLGIATTAALAASVEDTARVGRTLLVALDTKRGDFYVARATGEGLTVPEVVAAESLVAFAGAGPVLVVGDGADAALAVLAAAGVDAARADASPLVDAAQVARLAATADPNDPAFAPDPLYLRPPAVTLPGGGRVG